MKNMLSISKFVCFTALLIIPLCTLIVVKAGGTEDDDKTSLTTIKKPTRQKNSKGKILYMAESRYFSHFNYSVQLANTLHLHGYEVDYVVADYTEWLDGKPKQSLDIQTISGVKFIRVPVVDPTFDKNFFKTPNPVNLWETDVFTSQTPNFWESIRYRSVNLYKAVVENTTIVDGEGILDYLRGQEYILGMAEFLFVTSAFALFHELGIDNTIATSATPGMPVAYHILGYPLASTVPELLVCKPGDGKSNSQLRIDGSEKQQQNKRIP